MAEPKAESDESPFKGMGDSERRKEKQRLRKERREEIRGLSDEELADQLEYYRENSFGLQKTAERHRDGPVYDSVLWFVMLPEAIDRLREDD